MKPDPAARRSRRRTAAILVACASAAHAYAEPSAVTPVDITPPPSPASTQPATMPATQASTQPASTQGVASTQPTTLKKIVVSSDLDLIRDQIAPALGAVTYTLGPDQIQNIPGGENAPFQQLLLCAPGVVPDSFGQFHVRGEHANVTYRVNGILLPQPLVGFGQELDTRLVQSVTLIDGSLPAQFGFHTAGIVDVTSKSGASLNTNELYLYGGSHDTINPSFQLGGSDGRFDWFVTGSFNHSDSGLENPTPSHHALHDYTDQEKFFGYFSFQIDDTSRVSLILNASYAEFEIPDTAGLAPQFALLGVPPSPDSSHINEHQNEQNYYAVLAYQKSIGDLNLQFAAFTNYGNVNFSPDTTNDLIFQGVAGKVINTYVTNGIQFDASYALNDQHTLRGGFIADYTCEKLRSDTAVFPTNSSGDPTSNVPFTIIDNNRNGALESGLYLQDEWKITEKLTFNYGLRFDRFDANFDHESQLSPRANFVYKFDDKTTLHLGYSRFFVAPPVRYTSPGDVAKFTAVDNTNTPGVTLDDPPKVERSNYYDIGISHQITKPWQITLDGFYKQCKNLIDEGQFGAPVILSPFNYRYGTVWGAELGTTYKQGGLSLYGNFSWVQTQAKDPDSQQFLWDPDELAYADTHLIHLDHESEFSASAGASYAWKNDRVYADFLYASGLRSGFANTQTVPPNYPLNVGYEHIFRLSGKNAVTFRFDIVNVLDERYEIRDGSGIGVGAAQFGARRGFFAGLGYNF